MGPATFADGWPLAAVLWGMTWKASVLVAMVLLMARIVRRAAAAARHSLWAGAVVALVILPLLDAGFQWRVDILPSFAAVAGTVPTTGEGVAITTSPDGPAGAAEGTGGRRGSFPWGKALVLAWLAGSGVVAVRLLTAWRAAERIVRGATPANRAGWAGEQKEVAERHGLNKTVPLVRSREASIPFTAGIFRPVVVLPWDCEAWTLERRRAVLEHELAHVRRQDLAFHFVAQVACALHWYNPLVWLAGRWLRAESERACDDVVLRSGVRASRYAADLLDMGRASVSAPAPATAVSMAQASEFEGRLMAILHPGVVRRAPSRRIAVGIMAVVVVAAVSLAGLEPRVPARGADVATSMAADTTDVTVLLRVLGSDALPEVRATAAWALGQIADARSTAGLSAAARDADAGVRVAAVWALQELDDDRALPALLEALSDASVEVRRMAARGIADLTFDQAPAALLAATADPDSTVRRIAVWALGEIR